MTLFLDTEFNGHGGELISLALVSDLTGAKLYGVLPLPADLHPWVRENVVQVLDQEPEPIEEFRLRLRLFLERHAGEDIVADWPDDFAHLMRLMSGPEYAASWVVECRMVLVKSGEVRPARPHNALSDAKALAEWWRDARATGQRQISVYAEYR